MRLDGWEKELAAFLRTASDQPFVWGENDCCLFAANAVILLHGIDYAESFRGQYDSEETAATALATIGSGSLLQTMRDIMTANNIAEVETPYAQRGDLVYMAIDDQPALGIVDMSARFIIGMNQAGLVTLPIERASVIWGIR